MSNGTMLQIDELNAPISTDEILATIKLLANHKDSCLDGYTVEFYKAVSETFLPSHLSLCNEIWEGNRYMPTGYQVYIKPLSKKGKHPTLLDQSYC